MVLTLAKRDYAPERMDAFGMVVCDEAHHMAAPVMNQAMRLFRARYVVGLSATVARPDGLTPLLHWSLGPLGVRLRAGLRTRARQRRALPPHGAARGPHARRQTLGRPHDQRPRQAPAQPSFRGTNPRSTAALIA